MSATLVLDIETVPLAASLAAPYPRDERWPPKNYVKPEAIAAWHEREEAEWKAARVKDCSLNPRLGRILCVGFHGVAAGSQMAGSEADEAGLLTDLWRFLAAGRGRVVTFNGRTFDLRWIVLRSLALGIEPTLAPDVIRSWFAKYRVSPHTDVRDLLTNWDDKQSGTLADWCRFVGVPYENGHDGGDIYDLYTQGKLDEIAAKCRTDVAATKALYEKVGRMFCEATA